MKLIGERICRGCGCTDSRPCLGGCAWVLLDIAAPTGVCSQCAIDLGWHPRALIEVGTRDPQDLEVFEQQLDDEDAA